MRLKREAFGPCIEEVAAKAGVDDDTAFDIIQTVASHGERMRNAGEADPFGAAAATISQEAKDAAARARADVLRNAMVRNGILDRVREAGGLDQAELTLRSILHGTNKGERDSVQALWRGNASLWTGVLANKLRQGGLEGVAKSGALDEEISQALWAMNAGQPVPSTVSGPAKQIAEALKPPLDLTKERLNAAGANIGDATDYVTRTSHDWRKMRRAAGDAASPEQAFEAWWKFTEPLLGEKTFADLEPEEGQSSEEARRAFGESVFYATASGVHKSPPGTSIGIEDAPTYWGSPNIAKRASQTRVLHWRDGAAWNAYMKRFGEPSSLTHGVMQTLDASARQLALMEKFGTAPRANLDLIIRKLQEEYRGDLDGLRRFQGKVEGLRNVVGRLDGSLNRPENEMAGNIANSLRTVETTASLGSVGITHFASLWPTVTSEMAHHGVSRLETIGSLIHALTTGKGDAERQEILADLGAYAAGLNRDMESRWQADDPIPGRMSSVANTFMKFTGIHWVYDNAQAAIREMLAHNLGRQTAKRMDELDPHLSMMLGKYGIADGDWNVLRSVADLPQDGGRTYVTPSAAFKTDPADVEALLRGRGELGDTSAPEQIERAVQRYQWGLSDKLGSYYSDAAAHGVVTPGVQERAFILGNTRPGSLAGEFWRFFAQFKMWPVAVMNQIIGREIYMATSKADAAYNIGTMLAMTAAGGYMRMAINDALAGREQRNLMDPRTLMAALGQGGGIGILGDVLFGETNRMAGGLDALGGPVLSDAGRLFQIWHDFRDRAASEDPERRANAISHTWPELLHFGVGKIPFANLAYLKGALDYLLWYHLYEAASPGWWERTNQAMEREQGRTMMGYSPGAGVPYGVPGLLPAV